MNDDSLKQVKIIFIIGMLLIILAPYIFSRNLGLIDLSSSGQIGDTIGGITAPIANILGSILVFYALKAQIDANKLIQSQVASQKIDDNNKKRLQYFLDQFKILREDINDYTVNETNSDRAFGRERSKYVVTHKGAAAINYYFSLLKELRIDFHDDIFNLSPKLSELKSLLDSIDLLLTQIDNSEIPTEDKAYYKNLIAYQFNSKMRSCFKVNEKYKVSQQKVESGKLAKGIPDELFNIVDSIIGKIS